jgi:hypothetical protein
MTELHEAFTSWLAGGGRDNLPRDVALHASACPDCLRAVAAHDALLAIDVGAAPPPPLLPAPSRRRGRAVRAARLASGLAAVALIVAAGFVAADGILRGAPGLQTGARPTPQGEGILGGAAGPPSPTPSPSASATPTATPSPSPTATPVPVIETPNPPMGGGPPPIATLRPTPMPTAVPTLAPVVTPAPPTPSPTPVTVTPAPTPTPVQSASTGPSPSASAP